MKQISIKLGLILLVSVVFVFFQNCSPVKMMEVTDLGLNSSLDSNLTEDATEQPTQEQGKEVENKNPRSPGQEIPETELPNFNDTDEELIAKCESLITNRAQDVALSESPVLENSAGRIVLKTNELSLMKNIRGNVLIFADSADAYIDIIDSSGGNIVICGLSVNKIQNHTHGNLVIVGGNVNELDDFRGNLRLIGGLITGQVLNSKGKISYYTLN